MCDEVTTAIAAAYGWPVGRSDQEVPGRLVALNAERAEEERRGIIRWLRPEFQNPGGAATTQESLTMPGIQVMPNKPKRATKIAWPRKIRDQVVALRASLAAAKTPISVADMAAKFKGVKPAEIVELLTALEALGQARKLDGEKFAA